MEFDAVLIAPRRQQMVSEGWWFDRTLNDDLDACVAQHPERAALTSVSLDQGTVRRLSWRELATLADRVAVGLVRLGVGRHDVVSCQLPNGWAFTVTALACARIGAVINPLMHIFRERELSFMLSHGRSKVVIVPRTYRGFDHQVMLEGMRASLPHLEHVVVLGGDGADSFESRLSGPAWEHDADAADVLRRNRPGPDDVMQLIYTSGTTGEPKGVMHTANTLMANLVPFARRLALGADDVVLMASPMAHQTGFMYGLMMPVMLHATAVLQDIWNPTRAIELIDAERVSFTMASTPFLNDLTATAAERGERLPSLRVFLCAGAPIPGPLVERARTVLDAKVVSAWGMSENGAITTTRLDDDDERSVHSDGCPLPGTAVRVVDGQGAALPPGQPGRLLARACSSFGGYLGRPHLNATDAEGWFDTGDVATVDTRGYIRICGRSKDVIIRGGENIPVTEIEALLYRHPAIAQVAIVAYPDERLGERACACVVTQPGQSVTLADLVQHLEAHKCARQYMPERLLRLDAMPATPSGKIQKFKLRDIVQASHA